jgi:hypothetical protein
MNRLAVLLCSIWLVFFSACLVYEEMTVTITFDENFQHGSIKVFFTGISTSDSSRKKQQGDYEDLIEMLEEDDFLLDMVDDGIYIKERRIYEKEGVLYGYYSGVFRTLNIDGERLKENENERILQIDINRGDELTSNGRIYQSEDSTLIFWPKDVSQFVYTIKKSYDHNVYSLLPFIEAEHK